MSQTKHIQLVQELYEASLQSSVIPGGPKPALPEKPMLSTFYSVLRSSEFGLDKLKFHRVVEMGRCPSCCLLQHKCRTAESPVAREHWQRLAIRHQWLQRAQKTRYALDRATAARDYPLTCLYFAMDGGSGHDFTFPHLAGAAVEPNVPQILSK